MSSNGISISRVSSLPVSSRMWPMPVPMAFTFNNIPPTLTSFLTLSGLSGCCFKYSSCKSDGRHHLQSFAEWRHVAVGQLERPYPQYNGLSLGGYGCCSSSYNSFQATVTRRFQGGGTLLVAYTNAKLLTNTDTLTSWLEGPTGGVGGVQDWNNLNGERSLSSQDASEPLNQLRARSPVRSRKEIRQRPHGNRQRCGIRVGRRWHHYFPAWLPVQDDLLWIDSSRSGQSWCSKHSPPDVLQCARKGSRKLSEWFNTSCFAAPPDWGRARSRA